jgi:hypothetical protein
MIPTRGRNPWKACKTGKPFFLELIQMATFLSVKQIVKTQPAFTTGGLRAWIFNEHNNGLAKSGAILRIGRKVLIDNDKLTTWIESQNQGGK